MLDRHQKVLVTGARGLVGSALTEALLTAGFQKVLTPTRTELDLADEAAVDRFFECEKPAYVFMLAAKVGGIQANRRDPVAFLQENLKIQINSFQACHKHKTLKNLFLGSSCIYPKQALQPLKEDYLLTGPLEPTNEGYALAKITGLKMAEYYHLQHGLQTVCPLPCNIYGPNDTYDLENSHVLSALIKRFSDAKKQNAPSVKLWGSGKARREFIHTKDVARGLIFLMDNFESVEPVNLGTGWDITIRELAEIIAAEVGYRGSIEWDLSKPDGMLKKCLDVSKMHSLGFKPEIELKDGIRECLKAYGSLSC